MRVGVEALCQFSRVYNLVVTARSNWRLKERSQIFNDRIRSNRYNDVNYLSIVIRFSMFFLYLFFFSHAKMYKRLEHVCNKNRIVKCFVRVFIVRKTVEMESQNVSFNI